MIVKLHTGQLAVFNDRHKVRVLVAGRRFGKSTLMTWEAILAALMYPGLVDPLRPASVLLTEPTLSMARKIIWVPLMGIIETTDLGKYVKNISKTEFKIDFYGGKPSLYVTGALEDGGARLRGLKLWYAGLDEWQSCRRQTFDEVVYPATADVPGSRILIAGTPLGVNNILYTLFNREKEVPELYKAFNMPTSTNPMVSRKEIENARKILPPRAFQQEFEATFNQPEGQYYTELCEDNLVSALPARFDLTVIGYDFGDVNPCMVVLGRSQGTWYFLEGWQPESGEPIPQTTQDRELVRLAQRYNPSMVLCDPSRPSSIRAIRTLGYDNNLLGLSKATEAFNRIHEGISQVHSLIFQRRLKFSDRVTETRLGLVTGLQAYQWMQEYHREVKPDGTVTDTPADGVFSHLCDSLRYCIAMKNAGNI